jgi:TPR repeat protein
MESLKGLYHADKLDEQSFIDNFTIRLKEYRLIYENLMQQKQKPLQHFLITGKRGMGKSTLLRRIFIEASKPSLSDKLFAVRLGSEQYKLSRLFKLWEQVIDHLAQNEAGLLQQKKQLESSKEYENNLIHIVTDYLAQKNKTLLILIDNFDQFIDKLTLKEQHTLREILIQYPIQVIGNTIFYNEHFKSYNKPFYDFFKPIKLSNLDREEAEEFIKLRATTEGIENFEELYTKQYGKIQALRILSGGVPRTLLILLSIIARKNTGDAVDYLHEMIEQTTPLYQDRMKALSSQQQEIMHHLAIHWDRAGAKELATEMRIPSKSISAQLIQLESMGYINKVETANRNYLYEIDERFFNIWLLMSEAPPHDSKRVIWLTKWLDAFYSNDELKDFASFCHSNLKTAKPANRLLIAQALSESEKLDYKLKKQIVSETAQDLKEIIPETVNWENAFNYKMNEQAKVIDKEIASLIKEKQYKLALVKTDSLESYDEAKAYFGKGYIYNLLNDINTAEDFFLKASEMGNMLAMNALGHIYRTKKGNIVDAEKFYLMASNKGSGVASYNLGQLYKFDKKQLDKAEQYYFIAKEQGHRFALIALGDLYFREKGDYQNAEVYYRLAAESGIKLGMYHLGQIYEEKMNDLNSAKNHYMNAIEDDSYLAVAKLGQIFETEGNYDEAEIYYKKAIASDDDRSLLRLGNLYEEKKKDLVNAEKYYLMAIDKGNDWAMHDLGELYENRKDYANAEKYYLMAVDKSNDWAMLKIGAIYEFQKNDLDQAEKYYQLASESDNEYALFSLARLFEDKKSDYEKAESYYLKAISKGHENSAYYLASMYHSKLNQIDKAEKYYLIAIEKKDKDAMYFLADLYQNKTKDILKAEKYYNMAIAMGDYDAVFALILMYFESNFDSKKEITLDLCNKLLDKEKKYGFIVNMLNIVALLWNEKIKDACQKMLYYLNSPTLTSNEHIEDLSQGMLYFIIFGQKHFLYKIFQSNEEYVQKFKPVYYTLMHEMQDEYPKEYLKMTEELQEPVKVMLEFIKKEQKRLCLV